MMMVMIIYIQIKSVYVCACLRKSSIFRDMYISVCLLVTFHPHFRPELGSKETKCDVEKIPKCTYLNCSKAQRSTLGQAGQMSQ